jgi:hypothetical protein
MGSVMRFSTLGLLFSSNYPPYGPDLQAKFVSNIHIAFKSPRYAKMPFPLMGIVSKNKDYINKFARKNVAI